MIRSDTTNCGKLMKKQTSDKANKDGLRLALGATRPPFVPRTPESNGLNKRPQQKISLEQSLAGNSSPYSMSNFGSDVKFSAREPKGGVIPKTILKK